MNPIRLAVVAAALALATACDSRITGNEGNFEFSYPTDDDVLDFNKPVAVGAFLDVTVRDVDTHRPVEVGDASFDDPAVLDVDDVTGSLVTITGTGSGSALLTVTGTTEAGDELTDSVNMLARVPEVLNLAHTCGEGGAYLVSQTVYVPFELEMTNGQPVIGYGYYPVTLSDGALGTLDAAGSGQQFMTFDLGAATGTLTLSSTLDDTTLDMPIVEPGDLDGVAEPIAFVVEDIDVGDTNAFYVLPKAGGLTVCQADTGVQVTSDTPTICSVQLSSPPTAGETEHEYGWFEITGVAEGTCQYTVTYPAGNDGAGASAQFSYPIQP